MRFIFPDNINFWSDLVLQRTSFLRETKEGSLALNNWVKNGDKSLINKLCQNNTWRKEFAINVLQEAKKEAKEITDNILSINSRVSSLCSIGPGNGFIELFVAQYLNIDSMLLIDIESTPGLHHHAFNSQGAGYCSLESTKSFIEQNLSNTRSPDQLIPTITCCNPKKQRLPKQNVQLVMSLLSAGFHYPITQYEEFLNTCVQPNSGYLVYDKRSGISQKLSGFKECNCIFKDNKSRRIVCIRNHQ